MVTGHNWYFCVGILGGCCLPGLRKSLSWWRSRTLIAPSSPCLPSASSAGASLLMVSPRCSSFLSNNFSPSVFQRLTGHGNYFQIKSLILHLSVECFSPFFPWIALNEDQSICLQTCHSLQILSSSMSTELLQRWTSYTYKLKLLSDII